ncbi:hypothetical protein G9A89_010430 [Geosiphon pyriformis]|nr:hypothetical protein G9A89_010430 [Geosiphon pyriformis]
MGNCLTKEQETSSAVKLCLSDVNSTNYTSAVPSVITIAKASTTPPYSKTVEDIVTCSEVQYNKKKEPRTLKFYHANEEQDRLQNQHWIVKVTWGGNFSAPVFLQKNSRVLDVGCGPGTWVLDMATEYVATKFTGVDSDAHFPKFVKPRNASFIQLNVLEGLPWEENHFDFVYQRMLFASCTQTQYREQIRELVRIVKSGGWIEIMEPDLEYNNSGPVGKLFIDCAFKILKSKKVDIKISANITSWFESADLVDIKYLQKMTPLGKWGGTLGETALEDNINFLKLMKPFLQPEMGVSDAEYERLLCSLIQEVEEYHSSLNTFRCYGKKPAAE